MVEELAWLLSSGSSGCESELAVEAKCTVVTVGLFPASSRKCFELAVHILVR